MYKYYKVYKPYGYLSQFTQDHPGQKTLSDLLPKIDKDVYPVGRLDKDSEGLLLLTNHRSITQKLLHPKNAHYRTYHVQVEGAPEWKQLTPLLEGISFRAKKKDYIGRFDAISYLNPFPYPQREPPIRYRKNIPTTGLSVKLCEGKNRQVRKMLSAAGFPVLRLIRYAIEGITIEHLDYGSCEEIPEREFFSELKL